LFFYPILAYFEIIHHNFFSNSNDRIQGLAGLQQPSWTNQESNNEILNFGKPLW
jgi:hypothetical protein